MRARAAAAAVLAALAAAAPAGAQETFNEKVTINWAPQPLLVTDGQGNNLFAVEKGSAEGPNFGTVYVPGGDILNVRNIQGGTASNPNLDIGAGSTQIPGNLSLNWDVGRGVEVFDGRTGRVADFNLAGSKVSRFWGNVYVQNGGRIVLDAGQPNFAVNLRHLAPTPGYGDWHMIASDSPIIGGAGFGGNYSMGAPPCPVNAKVAFRDTGGKRVGWLPLAVGC